MGMSDNDKLRQLVDVDTPEVVRPALRRFRTRTFLLVIAAVIGGFLLILLGVHFVASNLRGQAESGRVEGRVFAVAEDASSLCINTDDGQVCGIPHLAPRNDVPEVGDQVTAYYFMVPGSDSEDPVRELGWVAFFDDR